VIVDATFADPHERAAIEAVPGASFRGLFLVADIATRINRVGARAGDASDADAAVARRQETYDLGPIAWSKIDASGPPGQTLALATAALT